MWLMENSYKCSNIVKFLSRVNKKSHISISNGNIMNKYAQFLDEHLRIQKGKNDKNNCFTYNHLYNFLHYIFNSQLQTSCTDDNVSSVNEKPKVNATDRNTSESSFSNEEREHTVLVSRKAEEHDVYLTDNNGREYQLDIFPFTIGRKKGNGLSLSGKETVSGEHAVILHENGSYYIEDKESANGTFLNQSPKNGRRIKKEKLKSGDVIYI